MILKAATALSLVLILLLMTFNVFPALGQPSDAKSINKYILNLTNKDAKLRGEAAWALGKSGDARAVVPLIQALKDSDSDVQQWAVLGLAKVGNSSVEPLIDALNVSDESINQSFTRWEAAAALGLIKDTRAVEPLIRVLKYSDNQSRYWAIIA